MVLQNVINAVYSSVHYISYIFVFSISEHYALAALWYRVVNIKCVLMQACACRGNESAKMLTYVKLVNK